MKLLTFRLQKSRHDEFPSPSSYGSLDTSTNRDIEAVEHRHGDREASPELARISALITRPPKQKQSSEYLVLILFRNFTVVYTENESCFVEMIFHSQIGFYLLH